MNTDRKTLRLLFEQQRQAFQTDLNNSQKVDLAARKSRLRMLRRLLVENQELLCQALSDDFGHRSAGETEMAEVLPSLMGIDHVLRHLPGWMKSDRRWSSPVFWPGRAEVRYQPKGVVGIMVPWNYPLYLACGPAVDALAAGNRVMIKMPEATPRFSACFAEMIQRYFDPGVLTVILGEVGIAQAFARLPLDHLLFTGSTAVGRLIMKAAAENLTPVTLELGGKSPAFVGVQSDLRAAAERIAFGKGLNAGQTCVAPDYALVPEYRVDAFLKHFRRAVERMYPDYLNNPDYSTIINDEQRQRLLAWLNAAESEGAKLHLPEGLPEDWRTRAKLPLLAVTGATVESALLQEEIFGPWLPIVTYRQEEEAIQFMRERPNPLALYVFSNSIRTQENILVQVPSGGAMVNNTLVHIAHTQLPFGGVRESGMGHYHGEEGFRTFSHARSVVHHGRFSTLPLVFPPYGRWVHRLLRWWVR